MTGCESLAVSGFSLCCDSDHKRAAEAEIPVTEISGTSRATIECGGARRACQPDQAAAVMMISTLYSGAASLASPVARAGVLPCGTQPSQTAFISAKVLMSASQMIA